jgi:hypothetical protein
MTSTQGSLALPAGLLLFKAVNIRQAGITARLSTSAMNIDSSGVEPAPSRATAESVASISLIRMESAFTGLISWVNLSVI